MQNRVPQSFSQALSARPLLPASNFPTLGNMSHAPRPPARLTPTITTTARPQVNGTLVAGASSHTSPKRQSAVGEWREIIKGPKQLTLQEQCDIQLQNRFDRLSRAYSEPSDFKTNYCEGNIFDCGASIAHCTASDFNMGRSFALKFCEQNSRQKAPFPN